MSPAFSEDLSGPTLTEHLAATHTLDTTAAEAAQVASETSSGGGSEMDGFAPACPPTQEELRLPLSPVQDNILASAEAALPPPLALPEALKGQSAEASPPAPEPEAESPAGAGLSVSSSSPSDPGLSIATYFEDDAESAIQALLALQQEPSPLPQRGPPSPLLGIRNYGGIQKNEATVRFYCRFPRCNKGYASTDAVRKHCRQRHLEWLRRLGHGCPALYCRWEE